MANSTPFKKGLKWFGVALGALMLILVILLAPFFILTPSPTVNGDTVKSVEDLDQYFNTLTNEGLPPAMSVTVLKAGVPVFAKAYGIADGITGEPATPEHVYHFWSMTKSITAVAIFRLMEQGKLTLDDPVVAHLPKFEPIDSDGNPVNLTIGNLIAHQSGLADFDDKIFSWIHLASQPRFGETRMVNERLINYRTVKKAPGTVTEYRNINYVLLGGIIEAVTGKTYEDYVRQEILTPLQMKSTDFVYRSDMQGKIVRGSLAYYTFFTPLLKLMGPEGGLDAITEQQIDDRNWLKLLYTDYAASTSLIGTSYDMARFCQMLINLGELDGARVISAEHARAILYGGRSDLQRDAVKADVNEAGLSEGVLGWGTKTWYLNGVEVIGHNGGGPGFALHYLMVPSKNIVVVVLTNSTAANALGLASTAAAVYLDMP